MQFKLINPIDYQVQVLNLLAQLNPDKDARKLETILIEMVKLANYTCFGLFLNDNLIGISSGWITIRIYCGKQLELDNVVIDSTIQSKGYGKYFIESISQWASKNNFKSISLNTYVQNVRSHKFYFNQGFKILGFHFENRLIN